MTAKGYKLQERKSRLCQHEGCSESEKKWLYVRSTSDREVRQFAEGNFIELCTDAEEREQLESLATTMERAATELEVSDEDGERLREYSDLIEDILER